MLTHVTLTATEGDLKDTEFVLGGLDQIVIGRASACELRLDDPTVSRKHCLIDAGGEAVWVRDLDSLNGTFVNGQRIGTEAELRPLRELHDGDRLHVGKQTFFVHLTLQEGDKEMGA